MTQTFTQKVAKIQKELKAPKNQRNKFGNYNYRNQEDILEAVKPLLGDLVLTVSDELVSVGNRVYVKSTSTITDGTTSISNVAYAREAEEQKGMSDAQLTGATSSYARKYSLNGLFLIDDTKDADTDEYTEKTRASTAAKKTSPEEVISAVTQEAKKVFTPEEKLVDANPDNAVNAVPKTGKAGWGKRSTPAKTETTKEDLY